MSKSLSHLGKVKMAHDGSFFILRLKPHKVKTLSQKNQLRNSQINSISKS